MFPKDRTRPGRRHPLLITARCLNLCLRGLLEACKYLGSEIKLQSLSQTG